MKKVSSARLLSFILANVLLIVLFGFVTLLLAHIERPFELTAQQTTLMRGLGMTLIMALLFSPMYRRNAQQEVKLVYVEKPVNVWVAYSISGVLSALLLWYAYYFESTGLLWFSLLVPGLLFCADDKRFGSAWCSPLALHAMLMLLTLMSPYFFSITDDRVVEQGWMPSWMLYAAFFDPWIETLLSCSVFVRYKLSWQQFVWVACILSMAIAYLHVFYELTDFCDVPRLVGHAKMAFCLLFVVWRTGKLSFAMLVHAINVSRLLFF